MKIDSVEFRVAVLPALVALKVLAYLERRPGETRDIADAYRLLVEEDALFDLQSMEFDEAIIARLGDGDPSLAEMGSYSVGRTVGKILTESELDSIAVLCAEAKSDDSMVVPDIQRGNGTLAGPRDNVLRVLRAFYKGMEDAGLSR